MQLVDATEEEVIMSRRIKSSDTQARFIRLKSRTAEQLEDIKNMSFQ